MQYDFEWDLDKAKENHRKHGVGFDQAVTVFLDARAMSMFDTEHSGAEDRWITLGISSAGGLLVVHHTFVDVDESRARIRIFSSRKATGKEAEQYSE